MKHPLILVVEDEVRIANLVADNLEAEGYRVMVVGDGESALRAADDGGIALILLDVMLPKLDGFEVCRRLREREDRTPILFLTARDLPPDRIEGLEAGGDDYLVKPFHLDELLARIRALIRRARWSPDADQRSGAWQKIGEGKVNLGTRESEDSNGRRDYLSPKEFGVLRMLLDRKGQVVSRDELLSELWAEEEGVTPRTVDNFIVRLRKRFEADPSRPSVVKTVRGAGYSIRAD